MKIDPFDSEELRWTPPKGKQKRHAETKAERKLPKPERGEAYLTGPIPMTWIQEATRLSGRTWQVACAL